MNALPRNMPEGLAVLTAVAALTAWLLIFFAR